MSSELAAPSPVSVVDATPTASCETLEFDPYLADKGTAGALDAWRTPFGEFTIDTLKPNMSGARDGPKTKGVGFTLFLSVPQVAAETRAGRIPRSFWLRNVRLSGVKPVAVPKNARPVQTLEHDRYVFDGAAWAPWETLQVAAYLDPANPLHKKNLDALSGFKAAVVAQLKSKWPEFVETAKKPGAGKAPAFLPAFSDWDAAVKDFFLEAHANPKGKAVPPSIYPRIAGWITELDRCTAIPSSIGYAPVGATFKHRPTSTTVAKATTFLLRVLDDKGATIGMTTKVPHTPDGHWDSSQEPLLDETGKPRMRRVGPADVTEDSVGDIEVEIFGIHLDETKRENNFTPKIALKTLVFVPAPRKTSDDEAEPAAPEEEDDVLAFLAQKKTAGTKRPREEAPPASPDRHAAYSEHH